VRDENGEWIDPGETERDLYVDHVVFPDAEHLEKVRGYAVARAFFRAATTDRMTIARGLDMWVTEAARRVDAKTIASHRRVLGRFDAWLQQRRPEWSTLVLGFDDVPRQLAGEFVEHRATLVSPASVKRESSSPMGLWRWAVRRGHAQANPWLDQTAGLAAARRGRDEGGKRPFDVAELVTLLHADGPALAPNGGGFGATLWDAIRLALLTGLRAGELADIRIGDLAENSTVIRVAKGKTANARRYVPLPRQAQRVLAFRLASLKDTRPDAPLWPELPVEGISRSRGQKLSARFMTARSRILPGAAGVDFHSLRRAYATALEAAMHRGGSRINPAILASLMGHERGTMALDLYSGGTALDALRNAVADMEARGFALEVTEALEATMDHRPSMVRLAPPGGKAALERGVRQMRVQNNDRTP
jgi:integrase